MKVVWTSPAIARLTAIEDHIAEDNPHAATRMARRLEDAAARLSSHPARGRRLPEIPTGGFRELLVDGYRLVYRVEDDRVLILSVFEAQRRLRKTELE